MSTIRPANAATRAIPSVGDRSVAVAEAPRPGGSIEVSGPQLSELGKRIEMLRLDRGVSKQVLARAAGTSRQQLWRVMTGKSELTSTLCQRLASVLDVDSRTLSSASLGDGQHPHSTVTLAPTRIDFEALPARSLATYLENSNLVTRTLRTLPIGNDGVALKCALLNAIEERAHAARLQIPGWLFQVRASVLDGTL
jgi:transcriptional regulator with XRE-family HTH domain